NPESDGALIATVQAQGARDGDDSAGILGEKAGSAIGEPNNQVTGLSVSDNSLNQGGRVDNDLRYAGQELLDSPSQTSSVLAPQSVISREASKTSTYSATLSSNTHLAEETAFSDTASLHADKSAKALTSANSSDAAVDNTLTASADSDLLDASDNKVSILGDSEEALLGSVSTVPNAPQASPTGLVRSAGEPTQPPVQQAPLRGNEQALAAQANLPVDDGSASMSDGMADKMDITKSIEGTAKVLDVAQQTANQQSARTPATQVAAAMTLAGQGKMGSNEWAQGLSQRVMVMTSQNNQFAEIQLDPPELGALRVKVQVTQEGVNVNFSSVHASVRDAVEQSIPRLREMMAEQGLSLGESSVSDESEQQAAHASQEEGLGGGGTEQNTMDDGHDDDVNELVNMAQPTGLVDFYA
ncbi:MAG: flagellar hook-length control protein FliK, partial [Pontibacterium sp.]